MKFKCIESKNDAKNYTYMEFLVADLALYDKLKFNRVTKGF